MIPKFKDDTFTDCLNLQSILFQEVLSEWKRNVAPPVWSVKKQKFLPNTRNPIYQPLCTYVSKFVRGKLRSNYDLHYVNPTLSDNGMADVAFYVLKYMMKPSNRQTRLRQALQLNLEPEEFEDVWKVVRSRHFESEALGLGLSKYESLPFHRRYQISPEILEHLRKGIDLSKHMPGETIPSFFSLLDGSAHPLAKYYKGNADIFNMQDFLDFFYASKKIGSDNVIVKDDVHVSQLIKRVDDFDKKVHQLDERLTASNLDDLFE